MFYVGADACKAGWFAVGLGQGSAWEVNLFPNINELWEQYKEARMILLDIPIGLPDEGHSNRSCDIEARELVAKRHSSVFPIPCRAAVYAKEKAASGINKQKIGRYLSAQSLAIIPKIKQVDQLLSENRSARSRIREVHPEVCFWALNHGKPMQYSKTKERRQAFLERKQVLISVYPHTQDIVDCALQKYWRYEVGKDDIVDALVAAVTAWKGRQKLISIPKVPEFDSYGLPMQMVCWSPRQETAVLRAACSPAM